MKRRNFIKSSAATAAAISFVPRLLLTSGPELQEGALISFSKLKEGRGLCFSDYWSLSSSSAGVVAIDRGHEWHIKGPPAASPNPRLTVHILKSEVSIIETFFNGIDFAEVELRRPGVQTYYRGEFTLIGVDNTGDLSKDLSTIFLTGRGRLTMGWDG